MREGQKFSTGGREVGKVGGVAAAAAVNSISSSLSLFLVWNGSRAWVFKLLM